MTDHFSTIGIPINSAEELTELLKKTSSEFLEISCRNGKYLKWSSDGGAELWCQIDKKGDWVGITPYFSGDSAMRVGIIGPVERTDDTDFERAIYGWSNPQSEDLESGEYPFVFDIVDWATYEDLDFPFLSNVSLSAFAHEISVYSSEEEYDSLQTEDPKLASESFIPSGLFNWSNEKRSHSEPYAMFSGRVLDCQQLNNPLTNANYHWALVKTLGGTIDVVCDPELLDRPIFKDGIVSGSFWLVGKIKEPKIKERKGLLSRFFT